MKKKRAAGLSALALFLSGGLYYGLLLWDSLSMTTVRITETPAGGYAAERGVITAQSFPYITALVLLFVFAAVQAAAVIRQTDGAYLASCASSAAAVFLPVFADTALAEFTRTGWTYPLTLVKLIPFVFSTAIWGVLFVRNLRQKK